MALVSLESPFAFDGMRPLPSILIRQEPDEDEDEEEDEGSDDEEEDDDDADVEEDDGYSE